MVARYKLGLSENLQNRLGLICYCAEINYIAQNIVDLSVKGGRI